VLIIISQILSLVQQVTLYVFILRLIIGQSCESILHSDGFPIRAQRCNFWLEDEYMGSNHYWRGLKLETTSRSDLWAFRPTVRQSTLSTLSLQHPCLPLRRYRGLIAPHVASRTIRPLYFFFSVKTVPHQCRQCRTTLYYYL
jgi:hypothetical protein